MIDELKIIDGFFDGERFIMRGMAGFAVYGTYKADGLRSLARLIHDDESFSLTIDKDRAIHIPVEQNEQIKMELNMIADELERALMELLLHK
ncbi:hypothetical protein [Bacillus sp. FJAT-52991]|uniref:Uncharacterized protein n=1 Tax=Bacillus kandeliae TaxID=3129297 RepID=A0ABZ2NBJ8_9BACI